MQHVILTNDHNREEPVGVETPSHCTKAPLIVERITEGSVDDGQQRHLAGPAKAAVPCCLAVSEDSASAELAQGNRCDNSQ